MGQEADQLPTWANSALGSLSGRTAETAWQRDLGSRPRDREQLGSEVTRPLPWELTHPLGAPARGSDHRGILPSRCLL